MSLTDKKARALCRDLRAEIKEKPSTTMLIGYQRMLAALVELLQHRRITKAILEFEHDPVATSFESIIRMAHQVHDKNRHPAPKHKEKKISQEAYGAIGDQIQAEILRNLDISRATQVEERCRG
jgi:hypothetical protein